MSTIYRGYDVVSAPESGFQWKDENGVIHTAATEEQALNDIDKHKRALRDAQG